MVTTKMIDKYKKSIEIQELLKNDQNINKLFNKFIEIIKNEEEDKVIIFFNKLNNNKKIFMMIKLYDYLEKKDTIPLKKDILESQEKIFDKIKTIKGYLSNYHKNNTKKYHENEQYKNIKKIQIKNIKKCTEKSINKLCILIIDFMEKNALNDEILISDETYELENAILLLNELKNKQLIKREKEKENKKIKKIIKKLTDMKKNVVKIGKSKKEKIILEYLEKNPDIILCLDEKQFIDLKNHGNLRYDFFCFIINDNGMLVSFIIEYDGEHHWKGFGDYDALYFMKNDLIKDFYAWENGYSMLRISYNCIDVNLIIKNFIDTIKKSKNILYIVDDEEKYNKKKLELNDYYKKVVKKRIIISTY